MRIVIDMQSAQTGSAKRGVGRYSMGLVKALLARKGEHEVILALSNLQEHTVGALRQAFAGLLPASNIVVWKGVGPTAWYDPQNTWRRHASMAAREAFLAGLNPDILLVPSIIEGFMEEAAIGVKSTHFSPPTVAILYDLIPLVYPELYLGSTRVKDWYAERLRHLQRADLWLAISEYSVHEGIEKLKLKKDEVVSILAGIDPMFRRTGIESDDETRLRAKFGLTRPFLLTAGGAEPRKNVEKLIAAFATLPAEMRQSYQLAVLGCHDEHHINAVGNRWPQNHALPAGSIVPFSHITDDELIALYSLCELFVFPSWYEGFGFPPLEAMACGAPVIAAGVTSLPEVIGRQDNIFDPQDVAAIAEKMEFALSQESFRTALAEWGPKRASTFTWERSAEIALDAMERLHARRTEAPTVHHPRDLTEPLLEEIAALAQDEATPSEPDLMRLAQAIADNERELRRVRSGIELPQILNWRIEGPFDSSYSLAVLNREFARALDGFGHEVALHSTEGPGDFAPNPAFLDANPDLARLNKTAHSVPSERPHVVSRNLYPPRVNDMNGTISLLHCYGWEESGFPQEWADNFSTSLSGMTCMSRHVAKIMVDHGVTCRADVSWVGVDHWERVKPDAAFKIETKGRFRFLHVSSCFPRKGAEIMLEAYGRAFSAHDDVTLVIKTFPNPHNQIRDWLAAARAQKAAFPDVVIIEDDLSDEQLKALYLQCHTLVAPSKAEGFGLPMAEAILSGLPVITTAWGGQLDFCNKETAWLIDYDFEPAQSHFEIFSSAWAKPRVEDLADRMREVYELSDEGRVQRSSIGRKKLLEKFRWNHVVERTVTFARACAADPTAPSPSIGWITTWNTRCGIAAYSAHLIENMPTGAAILAPVNQEIVGTDGANVTRCWSVGHGDNLEALRVAIARQKLELVVIQFNYGFFNFEHLGSFIEDMTRQGRTVIITLHATIDNPHAPQNRLEQLREPLSKCARILVHSVADLNRLKALGLIENVTLFPLGILDHAPKNAQEGTVSKREFVISSYGFFLPNKGLIELIAAVALLAAQGEPVKLKMINAKYPIPASDALVDQAKQLIVEKNLETVVEMETAFLKDEECLQLLEQADLIVFPYQQTGESASAAVRYGLAAGKPVAVTPLSIFDDVSAAVFRLPGCSAENIAQGIDRIRHEILSESHSYKELMRQAERWRAQHRYSRLGRRLDGMLTALTWKDLLDTEEGTPGN